MLNYNRLIANAIKAQQRCKSEWGEKYWGRVIYQLTRNERLQKENNYKSNYSTH